MKLKLFSNLAWLVEVVGVEIRPYCEKLLGISFTFWDIRQHNVTESILKLLYSIITVMDTHIKEYMKNIITKLVEIFFYTIEYNDYSLVDIAFNVCKACKDNIEDYVFALIPVLIRLFYTNLILNSKF